MLANKWQTLGGIAVRRSLPDDVKQAVNRVVRRSVEFAFAHRTASLPFVREHAQEMSEEVMYQHIDLYVNEYSSISEAKVGAPWSCSSIKPGRSALFLR